MSRGALFGALAVVAFGLCEGLALAKQKQKVLPLRVTSDKLDAKKLEELTARLVALLKKYPQFEVLPVPDKDPIDMMLDADCLDIDAACLRKLGSQAQADLILYTEVVVQDGRFLLNTRLVDVETGEAKSPQGGGSAETEKGLAGLLRTALQQLVGPLAPPKPAVVRVEVRTSPVGAEVYVDGKFVGISPATLRLKEGKHTLKVVRVGYQELVRELRVVRERPIALDLTLAKVKPVAPPVAVKPPPPKREVETPFYKTWWFWTAVGVVVVGGGTTAFLLASKKKGGGPMARVNFSLDSNGAARDHAIYSTPGL